jgi:hypothetical protein
LCALRVCSVTHRFPAVVRALSAMGYQETTIAYAKKSATLEKMAAV